MNTADPTTRPAFAFEEFLACSLDSALPGFELLGVFNPTDELVARQRSNLFPQRQYPGISNQRLAEIRRQIVNCSTGNFLSRHTNSVSRPTLTPCPEPCDGPTEAGGKSSQDSEPNVVG
jgi:hypothetical protein